MSGAVEAGTSRVARLVNSSELEMDYQESGRRSSELEMDYQESGRRERFTTSTSVRVCVPEIKTLYLCRNGCHV